MPATFSAAAAPAATVATVGGTAHSTYQTNGVAWAIASAGGVVYVGGSFTAVRPAGAAAGTGEVARTNFAAFDAGTGALLPCAPAFTATSGATIRAVTASADGGTLFVGGLFTSAGGLSRTNLAALDTATCTVKAAFAPRPNATVRAVALNTAGTTVYFGGGFHAVGPTVRNLVAAADVTTGALTAFDPNAVTPVGDSRYTAVRAIAVTGDDSRVVLGGDFDYLAGTYAHRLAVVNAATGALLTTFTGILDERSAVKALVIKGDNFYLGAEGSGTGYFDGRASVNLSTGTLNWRDTCLGATQALLIAGDTLYSGSHAHNCQDTLGGFSDGARHHLLAQDISTAAIQPWFPNTNDGINEQVGPRGLAMTAAGSLWVVGEFTTVNGVAQQGIARFDPKPAGNTPVAAPAPTARSFVPGQVIVRWRTAADIDTGRLTYRLYRDNVLINTQGVESRFFDRPQGRYVDTVAPGSFHVYKLDVSDGTVTSAPGGTVGITAATTGSTYFSRITADSPSLYWRLDDASATYAGDSVGTNPGVLPSSASEAVTYRAPGATADGNQAVTFGGDANLYDPNDGIQANNKQYAPLTFSTELWFKTTSTTGGDLISFGDGSRTNGGTVKSTRDDRHVYVTRFGTVAFGVEAPAKVVVTSLLPYNDGNWHHVVATLGASGQRLYLDGVLVASSANTVAAYYAGYWRVGSGDLNGWTGVPGTFSFGGSIDEVAVYPTVLSAARVAAHFSGHLS